MAEPGSITCLRGFAYFLLICDQWLLVIEVGGKDGGRRAREAKGWVHVHPVLAQRHHAPAGLRAVWVTCPWLGSWWGGQAHLPGG